MWNPKKLKPNLGKKTIKPAPPSLQGKGQMLVKPTGMQNSVYYLCGSTYWLPSVLQSVPHILICGFNGECCLFVKDSRENTLSKSLTDIHANVECQFKSISLPLSQSHLSYYTFYSLL